MNKNLIRKVYYITPEQEKKVCLEVKKRKKEVKSGEPRPTESGVVRGLIDKL